MKSRSSTPQATCETDAAADDQTNIDADMDDFEALIRTIHEAHTAGVTISELRAQLKPITDRGDAGPLLGTTTGSGDVQVSPVSGCFHSIS